MDEFTSRTRFPLVRKSNKWIATMRAAAIGSTRALAVQTPEQRRIAILESRIRYLPMGLKRARDRLTRLESEAIDLGMHDLVELRNSHLSGDLIATEWLRRLRA